MQMKDAIYFGMDLVEYLILGWLLCSLLEGMLLQRFYKKGMPQSKWLLVIQYAAVRLTLGYAQWAKQLAYGGEPYIADSRQSIFPLAVSFLFTLLFCMLLYRGNRMLLLSLVTAFYALLELVRFTLYPVAVKSIGWLADAVYQKFSFQEEADYTRYAQCISEVEMIWNLAHAFCFILFLWLVIRQYRKLLTFLEHGFSERRSASGGRRREAREASVLFVPELMGLLFTIMLRCILFYYKTEVYNLIEAYPELNLMIPLLSLLCIASILLGASMLGKLKEEHEKRRWWEMYQSQTEELREHVRDMEDAYRQIRGMKHDMKHYIADINALLAQMERGDERAGEEVRHYINSIQGALDEADETCRTNHPVTDVILGRYIRLAKQKGIAISANFLYPKAGGFDAFDLGVILHNALENAVEACEKESGQKEILLDSRKKGNMLLISVENSFGGTVKWEGGWPVSEKEASGHGLGLVNIRSCAEKYFGRVTVRAERHRFYLTVMLQGNAAVNDRKGVFDYKSLNCGGRDADKSGRSNETDG